jgi:hypothetical protein
VASPASGAPQLLCVQPQPGAGWRISDCPGPRPALPQQTCPYCREQSNGGRSGARKLRYVGLKNGLRIALSRPEWCAAHALFDVEDSMEDPGSPFSSQVADLWCRAYVPGWDSLPGREQRTRKASFLRTGQVCTEAEATGGGLRTILVVIEDGADGWQPFKRRQHSIFAHGFRRDSIPA